MSVDLFGILRSLFGAPIEWLSREVLGVSIEERREQMLAMANAVRALRRQIEIVRQAAIVETNLFATPPDLASGVLALAAAPGALLERLSPYGPDPTAMRDAPAAVAHAFGGLDLTVASARRRCESIINTSLTPQRERNVVEALKRVIADVRLAADNAERSLLEAESTLPRWALRRARS